jgi:superfamily II DNA or RNA helicase
MQIPPSLPHVGALVRVRRLRWRVTALRAYDDCQVLTLQGVGPTNHGLAREVIAPFDRIDPVERPMRLSIVARRTWRRACRSLIANCTPPGALRAARDARIDLLPYQLEPALAVLRGLGSRLLLADEVGLGKTIQAGLLLSELLTRGVAERALILTPAGLRDQWAGELSSRFALDVTVADARELRRRVATLGVGVNPWATMPLAIASIDFAKRPENLPPIHACPWDVLIVDEAHAVAADTDRRAAVETLAARAGYVLLLSATPHNGDREAFRSLCGLGAHGDRLLVFRRTRHDAGTATTRRIHRLRIRLSGAETRMHSALRQFTRAVREDHHEAHAVCLTLSVLHKRALSSAWSLAESVGRRLSSMANADIPLLQLALPLDPDSDDADRPPEWPSGPVLADASRERRLLIALRDAACAAAARETKISALRRLIHRVSEPIIVFTEFRDTLRHVAESLPCPVAMIHGGLTRAERVAALEAFTSGHVRLLLATDAAGEGLNLQSACRMVVNLELPWNPMRLEQRVGRVDRIGQSRPVHAFNLIARGSNEARILDRLRGRIARAQSDIGGPDPIGTTVERIAARMVGQASGQSTAVARSGLPGDDLEGLVFLRLEGEALAEAARLAASRRLSRLDDLEARSRLDTGGPWVVFARSGQTRAHLGRRLIAVWAIAYDDDRGVEVEGTLVPLAIELRSGPYERRARGARWLDQLLCASAFALRSTIEQGTAGWRRDVECLAGAVARTRLARGQATAAARASEVKGSLFQAGLFDRRADRLRAAIRSAETLAGQQTAHRLARLQRSGTLSLQPARLLLVLAPPA